MTYSQLKKRFEVLGGYGWFGTTGYLSTKYKFHFPNEEHKIQEAFSLFGQMLLMGKLTQNIEEEKSVLLAEYNRKYEHALARSWALQGRPYLFARHPRLSTYDSAIGVLEEFMPCSQEEIQTFYDTYYVPQNMSVVCIGAIPQKILMHILQENPFSIQKLGQRNSLPSPFSVHLPQKHEECIRMSMFSTLILSRASCSFEWVLPLHFTRHCVRIFCDMLEEILIEELRYKRGMTYDVDAGYEYWQDCRTLYIHFEIPPDMVEMAKDIVLQVLGSIPDQAHESFLEAKQEWLRCIYRMDYSGYQLLQATIADLEQHHRLVSFSEEIRGIEQTMFDHVVDLALHLTPERQFCFIVLP